LLNRCGWPERHGWRRLMAEADRGTRCTRLLRDFAARERSYRKRTCLATGMLLHRDGDVEGLLVLDPRDAAQAATAIWAARLRRARSLS
jgi:hypothetical protein